MATDASESDPWLIGIDGLSIPGNLDGPNMSDKNLLWFDTISGWMDSSTVRADTDSRASTDGVWPSDILRDGKEITITGRVFSDLGDPKAAEQLRDQLAAVACDGLYRWMSVTTPHMRRWSYVRLSDQCKIGWDDESGTFSWQLVLHSDLPWLFSDQQTKQLSSTISAPSYLVGLRYPLLSKGDSPLTIPKVLWYLPPGGSGPDRSQLIDIAGTAPSWPVITITGPAHGVTIADATSAVRLTWSGSIQAGQDLIIDCYAGTALVNDESHWSEIQTDDWLKLAPGSHLLLASGTYARATASWRSAWW
jgi:hypothetical protein